MDRGFWNYGLFWQIARQEAYFAIRLRRRIPLKTLKKLDKHDRLVTWKPSKKSNKKGLMSWKGVPRDITLRVIDYQIRGFRKTAVVTNMLDPQRVSRDEWTRLGARRDERGRILEAGLYHRRWEIETLFHELKVEQGMEGFARALWGVDRLRSGRPRAAVSADTLADGRGRGDARLQSAAPELHARPTRVARHATGPAGQHIPTDRRSLVAPTAGTDRPTQNSFSARTSLSPHRRQIQARQIQNPQSASQK